MCVEGGRHRGSGCSSAADDEEGSCQGWGYRAVGAGGEERCPWWLLRWLLQLSCWRLRWMRLGRLCRLRLGDRHQLWGWVGVGGWVGREAGMSFQDGDNVEWSSCADLCSSLWTDAQVLIISPSPLVQRCIQTYIHTYLRHRCRPDPPRPTHPDPPCACRPSRPPAASCASSSS